MAGLGIASGVCLALAFLIWFMGFFMSKVQDIPLGPFDWRLTGEAHRKAERQGVEAQRRLAELFARLRLLAVAFVLIAVGLFVAAMMTAN